MYYYSTSLTIKHEQDSFEAKCDRKPILEGWNSVIDAEPELLLKKPYNKVIHITRSKFLDYAQAKVFYHKKVRTPKQYIKLALEDPKFFVNLKRKYDKLQTEIEDPKFLRISLEMWNLKPQDTLNEILDFLGFPKGKRPLIIPVKFNPKKRNFEVNIP